MSGPTLNDVLAAIAQMRAEMTTKADMNDQLAQVRAEMSERFDRVDKRFDQVDERFDRVDKELKELDKDLTGHMAVHRELEKDIELLKRRPPRTAARAPRRR